ncbi:hypothetical protein EJ02DRAFT_204090 [Clathrospora elynae]|uniref:Zinc finger PHD-type domain-containing protein n=1 Tax=Clathrospora elynae TaxID=706981 RepID=A0A6A5SMJ6_9PLEO|nr:hypothetical protein EJ02DRAFT_204090 [Clathrospora elynae]
MSPRRSSRARTTQPPPSVATHSNSASSVSSARTDRTARVSQKQTSPPKSLTPHSLSSEEPEETPRGGAQPEPPLTRRRTREHDNDEDESAKLDDEIEDDMTEEDEVTRCVCGYQEYPGSPSDAIKSTSTPTDPDAAVDDLGGLFIQCDVCKVWQHGGCVGIMDEASSPDEYFCEQCRKDFHKVTTSSKGQRYSRYLPVYDQHGKKRKSSVSKDAEEQPGKDKDRNNRASVDSFGKRRSTMNSRAAYDEDEVLRKVLEESKHEGGPASENGIRKKRSRDDSEETKPEVKRQRTGSRSPSNSPVVESEDDNTKPSAAKQKPRGAAARSQREKELREKERDSHRTEAASRRKGRAERRKGDDDLEPTPTPTAEEPVVPPLAAEAALPEAPASDLKPPPAPRRGGRPPQKARGRLGRNQYSRDTVPATNGTSPKNDTTNSPQASATNGTGNGHDSSDGTAGHKSAKTKNWRLQKLSWNDIRKPAGAMQSYIAQRQVDMATGEKHTSLSPAVQPAKPLTNGETSHRQAKGQDTDLAKFKNLSTTQMMDFLSRDLVHWQQKILEPTNKSPK